MSQEIKITFESKFINRFTSSKKYKYSLIGKIIGLIIIGLYIALVVNPKAENLSMGIRIMIPTLILVPTLIYLFSIKYVSSIVFNKSKEELTINYYQYITLKSIASPIKNVEYYTFDMKDKLYSSKKTKFLNIVLDQHFEFQISASNLINSGLDYDDLLKFFEENGLKKNQRDFLLEDELDKTL